jgi:glycosyltransferase involved in cell wall biosynthesis
MVERGYHVTLFLKKAASTEDQECLDRWKVTTRILPKSALGTLRAFLKERGKYDLLCLHSVFTPHNWLAAWGFGCPRITTPNGGYSPAQIDYRGKFRKKLALFFYERRMLEKALFVHVLSQNEREQLRLVAPAASTVIAPNGFYAGKVQERSPLTSGTERRMLFIGRVALMHKGLDLLIKALSKMKTGVDWELDIVGPAESGAIETLEEIMKDSSCRDRVRFVGPLYGADKDKLVAKADVFVHTSRYEGMPFAVIEALSKGLPVMVTPGTNMADLVEEFEAGWVLDSEVPVGALARVLEADGEEYARRGRQAGELVRQKLNWDVIGKTIFSEVEQRLGDWDPGAKNPTL